MGCGESDSWWEIAAVWLLTVMVLCVRLAVWLFTVMVLYVLFTVCAPRCVAARFASWLFTAMIL